MVQGIHGPETIENLTMNSSGLEADVGVKHMIEEINNELEAATVHVFKECIFQTIRKLIQINIIPSVRTIEDIP